jgi:hypothetical protein
MTCLTFVSELDLANHDQGSMSDVTKLRKPKGRWQGFMEACRDMIWTLNMP